MQLHHVEREAAEQRAGGAEHARSPHRRRQRKPDLRRAGRDDPDVHHADGASALAHGEAGIPAREARARGPLHELSKRFPASRRTGEMTADAGIAEQRDDRVLILRLNLAQRYASLPERRQAAHPGTGHEGRNCNRSPDQSIQSAMKTFVSPSTFA